MKEVAQCWGDKIEDKVEDINDVQVRHLIRAIQNLREKLKRRPNTDTTLKLSTYFSQSQIFSKLSECGAHCTNEWPADWIFFLKSGSEQNILKLLPLSFTHASSYNSASSVMSFSLRGQNTVTGRKVIVLLQFF